MMVSSVLYQIPDSGYEKLPVLPEIAVFRLLEFIEHNPKPPFIVPGFQSTVYSKDVEYRLSVSNIIIETLWPVLAPYLPGYRPLFGTFIHKYPDPLGTIGLHDDPSLTNEAEHNSISLWIPLQDTDSQNGGFALIPGSQKWLPTLRNVGFPFRVSGLEEQLLPYLVPVDLKAGEPLVFDGAVLHATPPNITPSPRFALSLNCIPMDAEPRFYYRPNQDNLVQEWKVTDSFYWNNILGQPPKPEFGQLLREFIFEFPLCTRSQLDDFLRTVPRSNSLLGLKTGRSETNLPPEILQQMDHYPSRQIFHSIKNEDSFRKDGFLIVEDFFSPAEVQGLRSLYASEQDPLQGFQFHTTLFSPDTDYKRRLGAAIFDAYASKIHNLLNDYKPLAANFIIKEPGEGSYLPLHLDWSMLDERKYVTIAAWCTLTDLDDTNAPLGVYPGSHNAQLILRGSKSEDIPLFPDYTNPVLNAYRNNYPEVLLKLKAGTAVLYDQRLAHYSPANVSSAIRLAMNAVYIPAEAQALHYYQAPDKQIRVYSVESDFFYTHQPGQVPAGSWEPLDGETQQLTAYQFEQKDGGTGYNFQAPASPNLEDSLPEFEPLPAEPELGIPSSYDFHIQVSPLFENSPKGQEKPTFWRKVKMLLGI
jgi:ectoine hydroxylase-related dioxygenase (phytanoyl-CoA dioxygenase family)